MKKTHGMFIAYETDPDDVEGLLYYLFMIISDFHECLYCGKVKENVASIRSHMIDKGHCIFAFTEDLEQFYESWNVSEDNANVNTDPDNTLKAGADAAEDHPTDNITQQPHDLHPDSEHGLHLPFGRTLGHRSMSRYYRQNLHFYPTPAERAERRTITAGTPDGELPPQLLSGRQLATTSRSEMGMIGVGEFERRVLRATEKKTLKQETRARGRGEWKINKEANHQKHHRVSD
jgi:pre-60S factor REI1